MKKKLQLKTDDKLRSHHPLTNIVEGWFFRIDEISMGFYRVEGIDRWGRSISRDGIDPDELLKSCKSDILEISSVD